LFYHHYFHHHKFQQYDHDDSGGSLDTNLGDFLDSEGASGTSNNSKWRDWASGTGTSLNTRLFHKHGGSGSFMTRWKNWIAFSSTHSFNLDGSNDYLDLNVGNGLISRADIEANGESFSAWIKLDNVSGTKYIVCHGKTVSENNAIYGGIYVANTTARFTLYKNSAYQTISGTTTLSADTWYHIVGTYDGENNDDKMRIYINGSLEATSSALGGDFATGEPTIAHIGRNVNTSAGNRDFYFDGLIDEVAIFDTALSAILL
jgi:hypothetical protein